MSFFWDDKFDLSCLDATSLRKRYFLRTVLFDFPHISYSSVYNEKVPTQCHSCSRSIIIDPEGHPGQNGDEDRWHVSLQDEVTNVPLNSEAQR